MKVLRILQMIALNTDTFSLTLSALIRVFQLSLFIATCKECRFLGFIRLTFFVTGGDLMRFLGLNSKHALVVRTSKRRDVLGRS